MKFLNVGEIGIFEGIKYLACKSIHAEICTGCDLYIENKTCGVMCYNTTLKRVDTSTDQSPKPLYEIGEIIEVNINGTWEEVEHIHNRNNNVVVWMNGQYHGFCGNLHRKKQTEKTVTLENRVITVKEAFKYLTNL